MPGKLRLTYKAKILGMWAMAVISFVTGFVLGNNATVIFVLIGAGFALSSERIIDAYEG